MDDPTTEVSGSTQSSPGAAEANTLPPSSKTGSQTAPAPSTGSPEGAGAGGGGKAKRPVMRGPLFAVVAILLLIASALTAFVIFKRRPISTLPPAPTSPNPSAQPTKTFRDAATGIAFDYPADWGELTSPSVAPTTKAIFGTGRGELVKLDVYALEEPPTTDTIATREVQDALDKIISDNADATITLRELKNVNGINTWHYVSQFRDPELGVGVHDVWFFFSGVKLEKLLFQAFPISDYDSKYKAEFEDVVRSYHTVPRGKGGATPAPSEPAPSPSR